MKQSLQGEGTYTYECDKVNCFHCLLTANVSTCKPPDTLTVAGINKRFAKRFSKFSKSEDEILRNYKHLRNYELADLMGRPPSSIQSRRRILATIKHEKHYSFMKPFYI